MFRTIILGLATVGTLAIVTVGAAVIGTAAASLCARQGRADGDNDDAGSAAMARPSCGPVLSIRRKRPS